MYIKTFPTLNSLITLYTLQVLPIFKARGCPYLMDLFLVWIATYQCNVHVPVAFFQSSQYIDCEELSQTFYTTA